MARLVYASQRYVENPMLSLIVPVYNTPVSLLTRALQPFIDQQYSDMEVILVDDASQSLEHSEVHALLERLKTSVSLFRHSSQRGAERGQTDRREQCQRPVHRISGQ
mgnify:CR=1 FL=1